MKHKELFVDKLTENQCFGHGSSSCTLTIVGTQSKYVNSFFIDTPVVFVNKQTTSILILPKIKINDVNERD